MKDKGSLSDVGPRPDELHTPGPWRAEQSNEPDVHKRPNERDDTSICVENAAWDALYVYFPWPGPENTLARHEANARLIAAAPDLLDALKRMYAAWNARAPIPREDADELEFMCRAVLAKAT